MRNTANSVAYQSERQLLKRPLGCLPTTIPLLITVFVCAYNTHLVITVHAYEVETRISSQNTERR